MSKLEFMLSEAVYNVSETLRSTMVNNVLSTEISQNLSRDEAVSDILIVPDQFHFETEKAVYRAFGNNTGSFPRVKITTISKLTDEIIEKFGRREDKTAAADDITKTILMYRAVNELENPLSAFGSNAKKSGFPAKMYSTISMLKNAGYTSGNFALKLDAIKEDYRSNHTLFAKLEDIKAIYEAFELQLARFNQTDGLDRILTASRLAIRCRFFNGKNVYFDKFCDFSERQLDFVRTAVETSENAYFAFTANSDRSADIFAGINALVDNLSECAENSGKEVIGRERLLKECRFEGTNPALEELAVNFFADKPDRNIDMSAIRTIHADDIHSECDFIAAEIRKLCVTGEAPHLCYKDITVLCSSPADYKAAIQSSFEKYEIPIFCDIPESIIHLPLVNLITSLLNLLRDCTVENIISYVKTGFLRKSVTDNDGKQKTALISMKEISDFEDYIFVWGLKAKDLEKTFTIPNDAAQKSEKYRAENAELVRRSITEPLLNLRKSLKDKQSGAEITQKICSFLFDEIEIEKGIKFRCSRETDDDIYALDKETAASYQRLWNKLLEIFESLNAALGDGDIGDSKTDASKMSVGEYYHLFRDICSSATLALPPEVNDSVLVGDISRTKTENSKVVFIAGACNGQFPAAEKTNGIFSEYETELLGESDIKIAKSSTERYFSEMYQAYTAVTSPSEKLYLTYPTLSLSCEEMTPAEIITQLWDSYDIEEESASSFGDRFYSTSRRAAQQNFAKRYSNTTEERETLRQALSKAHCDSFIEKLDSISQNRKRAFRHRLAPATSAALFSKKIFSATNIEKLSKCRFMYFCQNGLRINPPFKQDLNSANVGTITHYILQQFLQMYCNKLDEFVKMSREDMSVIVKELLDRYKVENFTDSTYFNSDRFKYLYDNIIALGALDILTLLKTEFAARQYRPVFFELSINEHSTECISPVTNFTQRLTIGALPEVSEESSTGNSDDGENVNTGETLKIKTAPYELKINDYITVKLTGNVDRVDMFAGADGKKYLRVVDYKTGVKYFGLDKALFGVSSQMLLYLITLTNQNHDSVKPGGISYMPSMAAEADGIKRDYLERLFPKHHQSGILVSYPDGEQNETLDEAENYAHNIKALGNKSKSAPYPEPLAKVNYDSFADECIGNIKGTIKALYDGEIDAIPAVYTENNLEKRACSYCSFKSVCGCDKDNEFNIHMGLVDPKYLPDGEDDSGEKSDNGKEDIVK